ncbi:MAG: YihY/virulence factor BrkB family protein [Candidatus Dormibacteria bacterium]
MIDRLKTSTLARVIGAYGSSQAGNYANGLAFNAFMTMFPLILGVLSIVGLAIHDRATQLHVQDALLNVFPTNAQQEIAGALTGVRNSAGLLGIISILGLIWAGTNFFAALEFALSRVFDVPMRDFLRQRAMGLIMMVVLIVSVVVSVVANSLMDLVPFMAALGPVAAMLSMVVLVVLIYRFVPNRTFRLSEIWPGALIAGVLIEVISLVFPLYARLVHGFNSYGAQFALFFLLATWLLFMSQFILLGAVFNRVRMGGVDAEGVVAAPAADAREVPNPSEAVEHERARR